MQQDELLALISQTSVLVEQFGRHCEDIEQRQQALAQVLQNLTQQLPAVVKQSADGSLLSLPGQVASQVKDGLDRPMNDYQQRLRSSIGEVGDGTRVLAQQINRLEKLHRNLVWKTFGAVAACFLLLLAGGIWLTLHYTQVIDENQLDANLMKAYNSADVVVCEKGQLCANVDTKGRRYGDRKQYLPVLQR